MESLNSPDIIQKTIHNCTILEYHNTNIYIIENVLDDELCHEFTQLIKTIPKRPSDWKPGNNVRCFYHPLDELRQIDDVEYYPIYTEENDICKVLEKIKEKENITMNRLNGVKRQQIINLEDKLNKKLYLLNDIFKELFQSDLISFNHHSGIILRKIHGETREHCDGESLIIENSSSLYYVNEKNLYNEREKDKKQKDKVNVRILTTVFALNDDYEGGEFCFPKYNIKTKLKKGSIICFPPYWTHNHRVEAPLNNTFRYTLNTWIYKNEYAHSNR